MPRATENSTPFILSVVKFDRRPGTSRAGMAIPLFHMSFYKLIDNRSPDAVAQGLFIGFLDFIYGYFFSRHHPLDERSHERVLHLRAQYSFSFSLDIHHHVRVQGHEVFISDIRRRGCRGQGGGKENIRSRGPRDIPEDIVHAVPVKITYIPAVCPMTGTRPAPGRYKFRPVRQKDIRSRGPRDIPEDIVLAVPVEVPHVP